MPRPRQPDLFDTSSQPRPGPKPSPRGPDFIESSATPPDSAASTLPPPSPPASASSETNGDAPPPDLSNGHALQSDGPLRRLIDENFLQYASYVIRDRAIPQLEDGLKPVQRRILHSLFQNDDGNLHKVANIVGDTMKYHPHGDAAIAEALVGLVQKRYLIEGQGNFGNILTGAPAAAPRYPECRLTELARRELFNPKITEFVPSYDGRNREPVTLPSKLPLLLMLGAEGIAVGLATRILPHNFVELIKAQIAILENKRFKVLPDFPQGGLMDASAYDQGRGKVTVRAVIEPKDSNKLVIREIPFSTTTESLIASIEAAVRGKKLRIRSIDDFTAAQVEIVLTLTAGEDQEKTLAALFHFTQCEVSLSSNIVAIQGDRPVELTVEEVLRFNTEQLLRVLKAELELRRTELTDELHYKSLAQIFIENRIYKKIEDKQSYDAVQQAVLKGLAPFRSQLTRDVTLEDVERLLDLRIKRISLFDLKKNQDDIDTIVKDLKQVEKHLKQLTPFAISYLESLLATYGKEFKRRTKLTEVEETDVRELTANQLGIVYDRESGHLGFGVRGAAAFRCSPLDKLLLIRDDGRYSVVAPPEKEYVGKDLMFVAKFDRDHVFTLVYADEGAAYLKRFTLGGAIMNRDYSLLPDGGRILFFTADPVPKLRVRYRKVQGLRKTEDDLILADYPVRGVKTRGHLISRKSINGIDRLSR